MRNDIFEGVKEKLNEAFEQALTEKLDDKLKEKINESVEEALVKQDAFDQIEEDVFDQVEKEVPKLVRTYIKKNTIGQLTISDVLSIVRDEISKTKPRIIEKTIETKVKEVPAATKEQKDHSKEISELTSQIAYLKDELNKQKQVLPLIAARGGSGVIGVPNPQGQSGKYLTNDGNQISWGTVSSSGSTGTTVSIGDPTTDGSWQITVSGTDLSFQRRESGSWVEKGAMLA